MTHPIRKRRIKARYFFLLIIVAVPIAFNIVYRYHAHRKYTVDVRQIPIPEDSISLLRGKVISSLCEVCHGVDLGGKMLSDNYFLGSVHAPNITRGEGSVTKDFSDSDWIRIVHHAVRRDGLPAQEKYRYDFSERELGELIAYLKTLPPVDRAAHPIERTLLGESLAGFAMLMNPYFLYAEQIDHTAPCPTKDYLVWEAVDLKQW